MVPVQLYRWCTCLPARAGYYVKPTFSRCIESGHHGFVWPSFEEGDRCIWLGWQHREDLWRQLANRVLNSFLLFSCIAYSIVDYFIQVWEDQNKIPFCSSLKDTYCAHHCITILRSLVAACYEHETFHVQQLRRLRDGFNGRNGSSPKWQEYSLL